MFDGSASALVTHLLAEAKPDSGELDENPQDHFRVHSEEGRYMMSLVEFFSQPVWHRLGLTLAFPVAGSGVGGDRLCRRSGFGAQARQSSLCGLYSRLRPDDRRSPAHVYGPRRAGGARTLAPGPAPEIGSPAPIPRSVAAGPDGNSMKTRCRWARPTRCPYAEGFTACCKPRCRGRW